MCAKSKIFKTGIYLCMLITACSGRGKTDTGERIVSKVSAVPVVSRPFDNNLNSFGTISYKIKNDITAQVEGTIAALNAKEGDTVRAGQQIARLRNVQLEIQKDQYENSLTSAQAALYMAQTKMQEARLGVESRLLNLDKNRLTLAQQELELEDAYLTLGGRKELHGIGGITDANLKSLELSVSAKEAEIAVLKKDIEIAQLGLRDADLINAGYRIAASGEEKINQFIELNTRTIAAEIRSAEANVRNAEKSLDAVQKLLDELIIRSSVSGVVGTLYFENGEHIPQNEKIATVMDISTVYAVFYIQEQDIINFSQGTPLDIEIPSLKQFMKARIDEISPIADPQSGNFSVKAEIPNTGLSIKPGMFIKCVIPRSQEVSYPSIPETALLRVNGNDGTVFTITNGVAVVKQVHIQAQKDGIVWISSGINERDTVIDKPSPFLKEGEYVERNQ
ncbi:hemolysin D [Spirochaetia bacterium]|nr:hemolysin D [Spirochaetia bacterium]